MDELPGRGGGVDGGALAGEDLQADAAFGQVVDDVDQMAQIPRAAKSALGRFPDSVTGDPMRRRL